MKRGCGIDNLAISVKEISAVNLGLWALHCDQRKGHLRVRPLLSRVPGAAVNLLENGCPKGPRGWGVKSLDRLWTFSCVETDKNIGTGWRADSAVKSTGCFLGVWGRPRFEPWHPHSSSEHFAIPGPGDLTPASGLLGPQACTWEDRQTCSKTLVHVQFVN